MRRIKIRHAVIQKTLLALLVTGAVLSPLSASAQVQQALLNRAGAEKAAFIDTLRTLCNMESGSRDVEGLAKIADFISARLKALGGEVQTIDFGSDLYRMEDTPPRVGNAVRATFKGTGTKKIMLIAHMDTVYLKGMLAKQPFRIEGDKAYGLGIADDKNGVALILHVVKMLNDTGFRDYGTLTVLINGDEEISTPGARKLMTQLGAEHDATMSFEGTSATSDGLALATSGIAAVVLNVTGKASHAGGAPERGINSLYEIAHQILQTRDLSDPTIGLKMNWTIAKAGSNRNVIPADAQAMADVRVLRVADYSGIEQKLRERIKKQLLPDAKVELIFEKRRPPLETSPASIALAQHAQTVYRELGKDLVVATVAGGGGTDAAFVALATKNAVVERFGLQGFGAHSNDDEYVLLGSIEPRMYLATRLVMDIAQGKLAK